MELLKLLYEAFVDSDYYEKSDIAEELSKKSFQTHEKINSALENMLSLNEISNIVTASELDHEEGGFILGFKCAVMLLSECGFNIPNKIGEVLS